MNIVARPYFWPVTFLLAFVAVLCKFYPVYQAVALIPALTAGIILIDKPRRYILFYLFMLGVFPLLQRILPMGLGTHLDELIGGAIMFLFAMGLVFRKFGVRTSYQALFFCLMAWCVGSVAFNQSSIVGFLRFLLAYGLFFPVYLLAKTYMKLEDIIGIMKGGIVIFWINALLNLGWHLGINPIFNEFVGTVDFAIGTLNGCNFVAYFCSMLAYFLIGIISFKIGSKRFRAVVKVTLLAIFAQLYFAYTNHAIVLFVAAGIPLLILTKIWKGARSVIVLFVAVLGVVILMQGETELAQQLNPESLRMRKERLRDSAKVLIYNDLIVNAIHDNPQEWLMGAGPGYGIGPIGKDNVSPMAMRYLLQYFGAFGSDQRKMQFTSITGNANSAILTIWSDIGMAGSALYFLPFFMMMMQALVMARNAKSPERKAFAIGLLSSTLFLLVMCILIDLLHIKFFSYALWTIFGILSGDSTVAKDSGADQAVVEENV